MKWFKHDTNAMQDAKIERLIMRHTITGYGVYFGIVELIGSKVSPTNFNFELEHDAEILSNRFKLPADKITEILLTCIELNLLCKEDDVISCPKIGERLDNATTQNPEIKKMLGKIQSKRGAKRKDNSNNDADEPQTNKATACPVEKIVEIYHTHCPKLNRVRLIGDTRKRILQQRWREKEQHQSLDFWERYFAHVAASPFLMGESEGERKWAADFGWLIKSNNFIKVIEGNYHGR